MARVRLRVVFAAVSVSRHARSVCGAGRRRSFADAARRTLRITLVPPFAATYSASLSCLVSAVTGAGSATAALSFVSQFLAPFCCGATSAFLCGARGASGPVNACAVASKAKAMLSRAIFTR